jgi:hypothetical protein
VSTARQRSMADQAAAAAAVDANANNPDSMVDERGRMDTHTHAPETKQLHMHTATHSRRVLLARLFADCRSSQRGAPSDGHVGLEPDARACARAARGQPHAALSACCHCSDRGSQSFCVFFCDMRSASSTCGSSRQPRPTSPSTVSCQLLASVRGVARARRLVTHASNVFDCVQTRWASRSVSPASSAAHTAQCTRRRARRAPSRSCQRPSSRALR